MKSKMWEILALSALMGGGLGPVVAKEVTGKLPEKPQPKGTKEYFFDKDGNFSTERMLREACVFKCFALNDKNAKKKFQKFMQHSEQNVQVSDTTGSEQRIK